MVRKLMLPTTFLALKDNTVRVATLLFTSLCILDTTLFSTLRSTVLVAAATTNGARGNVVCDKFFSHLLLFSSCSESLTKLRILVIAAGVKVIINVVNNDSINIHGLVVVALCASGQEFIALLGHGNHLGNKGIYVLSHGILQREAGFVNQ